MKNKITLLPLLVVSSLIASAGCSDRDKNPDPTASAGSINPSTVSTAAAPAPEATPQAAPAPAPVDPFAGISAALDKVTMAQTPSLAGPQQAMDRAINARIEAWKATGVTSTNKSDEKLALARTDFAQKISALSTADDSTWKNAKGEALASLKNLQQAFQEYLAAPVKN